MRHEGLFLLRHLSRLRLNRNRRAVSALEPDRDPEIVVALANTRVARIDQPYRTDHGTSERRGCVQEKQNSKPALASKISTQWRDHSDCSSEGRFQDSSFAPAALRNSG